MGCNPCSRRVGTIETVVTRAALTHFRDLYDYLEPEKKELRKPILPRVVVSDIEIVLEINANVPALTAGTYRSASRSVTPNWLPDQDSNLEPTG